MRLAMFGLLPVMLLSGAANAQDPQWRISEVSGEVRVLEAGRARPATRGLLLASGAAIATGASGRAVLVRGRQFVMVSPRSQMRLPGAGAPRGLVQVIADFGTALFRIDRRDTPHFSVQTPYLAAVVKGTVFTVTVGPAGAAVQVTEGAVEVATVDGRASDLVRPGMIASVDARDLYQLSVQGEGNRVIRSDGAPAAGRVAVPPSPGPSTQSLPPIAEEVRLDAPVREEPVALDLVTDGLVRGSIGVEFALAAVRNAQRSRPDDTPGPVVPRPEQNAPVPPPSAPSPGEDAGTDGPDTDKGGGRGGDDSDDDHDRGNGNDDRDRGNGRGGDDSDDDHDRGKGNDDRDRDNGRGGDDSDHDHDRGKGNDDRDRDNGGDRDDGPGGGKDTGNGGGGSGDGGNGGDDPGDDGGDGDQDTGTGSDDDAHDGDDDSSGGDDADDDGGDDDDRDDDENDDDDDDRDDDEDNDNDDDGDEDDSGDDGDDDDDDGDDDD